jgi:rubrerythrin
VEQNQIGFMEYNLMDRLTMKILKEEKIKSLLRELFVQAGEIEAQPKGKERDLQILRIGMIAELDAVNLYDRLAQLASNPQVTKLMLDVSQEEKVHAGEFETLMEELDPSYEEAEEEGEKEVKDLLDI